jgi:starch synthase
MNILMVSAELTPLAKTGGLADATAGLSGALAAAGHDVRVLMPRYASIRAPAGTPLRLHDGTDLEPLETRYGEPRIYLHGMLSLAAAESIYTGDARDGQRFLGLALAAAQFAAATDWQPDVYHCHDWHAGLVPHALALAPQPSQPRAPTVLTLHNIGYQGIFTERELGASAARLGARVRDADGRVNFLRSAIRAADAITTVSPTYAREILTPEYGMGLESAVAARSDVLSGILNGVDYGTWDPRRDPYLAERYTTPDAPGKAHIKHELAQHLGLAASTRPIVGLVSRLAAQKGIDIFAAALPGLLESTDAAFALLGSGEAPLERALHALAARHPERIAFVAAYNERLAHTIIAGSDFLLVPSRYEPCGLTQLYALRYGTVPIVRATGGLADTVQHFDPATGSGNGCVFADPDVNAISWAVSTALAWRAEPTLWQRVRENAMAADHSWHQRIADYVTLYERTIADARRRTL